MVELQQLIERQKARNNQRPVSIKDGCHLTSIRNPGVETRHNGVSFTDKMMSLYWIEAQQIFRRLIMFIQHSRSLCQYQEEEWRIYVITGSDDGGKPLSEPVLAYDSTLENLFQGHLKKILSAKLRPFCCSLNVLKCILHDLTDWFEDIKTPRKWA